MFGTLTGYELSHLLFGERTGASVDGRYEKESFNASVASYPGADKNGITAFLKSAAKINPRLLQSSVVVNLKIDRIFTKNADKLNRLIDLLYTYFKLGGIQLQINYLSADELIEARRTPDRFSSLRVRVTGFSSLFTALNENLQDEIINRTLHLK